METSLDIVNLIHGNKRSDALDKIEDLLYKRAAEVIDDYKKVVASTYFDEPTEDRKSTRLNSSHVSEFRMPSSA